MEKTSSLKGLVANLYQAAKIMLFMAAFFIIGFFISQANYLLFHTLAEMYTILISFGIALIVFNARLVVQNGFFMLLGMSFGFSGVFDLLHTFVYQGMGVFPGSSLSLAPATWLVARFIDSATLLFSIFFLKRKLNPKGPLLIYGGVSILMFLGIFCWYIFPVCFIVGQGLTSFKIYSEYVICVVLIISIILLFKNQSHFHQKVFKLLVQAYLTSIGTELSFTLYSDMYGLSNMVGHLFKVITYSYFYKAIVETSLREPYKLLFYQLQQKKDELEFISFHDKLTGLYNRAFMDEYFRQWNSDQATPISLIAIDIDGMKLINDNLGHAMGDVLLKKTSQIMEENFRKQDWIARIGGDEFVVILKLSDEETAAKLVQRLEQSLVANRKNKKELPVFLSCGYATFSDGDKELDDVLRRADARMYSHKAKNREVARARLTEYINERQMTNDV